MKTKLTSPMKISRSPWLHLAIAVIVFVIILFIWWYVSIHYESNLLAQKRAGLKSDMDRIATYLTSNVNRRQAILIGLSASVKTHSVADLRNQHFEIFATGLKADDPVIQSIQFFPVMGYVLVFPEEENETVLNSTLDDLRNTDHANVREDVQRAIDTGEITLSKPYELKQGGTGVVARLAVYKEEKFLGLVTVVLNLDPLLEISGVSSMTDNVQIALMDTDGHVFFGEESVFQSTPVTSSVVLPEDNWVLGATPLPSWYTDIRNQMLLFWLMGGVLGLLGSGIAFLLFSRQSTLKKTVEERTAALSASELRYTTTLKVVNKGIWDWQFQTGELYCSEHTCEMLGYEQGRFTSIQDFMSIVHPQDLPRVQAEIDHASKTGSGFDLEMQLKKKDGNWICVLLRGRFVENPTGGHFVGTLEDITERKVAEEQLRASESKFRALFENDHAIMMIVDPKTSQIIDANPAASKFYGWSRDELHSKKISDINTLSEAEVLDEMKKALNDERQYFRFRHRLASGQIRDVEVFTGPIQYEGRTLLYSIIHDVTFLRQAENALRESENRLRFALDGANDGLWDVQLQSHVTFFSPRACEILGYLPSEAAQIELFLQSVHPDDMEKTEKRLKDHLEGRVPIFELEHRLRMKSGEWKWVSTRGKLVERDQNGSPLRLTGTYTDISRRMWIQERMKAAQSELERLLIEADENRLVLLSVIEDQKITEEKLNQLNIELEQRVQQRTVQLEAANKELEAFSYSVSHDLRAPLRSIDGWSLALLEDYGDQLDENGHQYLDRVRSETQRMGQLIDDILRLSRVTRMEMNYSQVNLSSIAQGIADRLREESTSRSVEFAIQPDMMAQGDANLLEIALSNLLANAYKFTARKDVAHIEFGKMEMEGELVYFVSDNGAGFDMAYAKKLFGAFQRMHKQTDFPGTGIGLATVQRIIHRHGGRVWAQAEKGHGAIFYFTLAETIDV